MSSDLGTQFEDIVEWVTGVVAGLGFLLPIAAILLFNMFGKKRDKQPPDPESPNPVGRTQPAPIPTTAPDFPMGSPTWMEMGTPQPASTRPVPGMSSAWGSTFDGNDSSRHDEPLQWGSAFDDNDAALEWGSAFENASGRTKWGFETSEWKSSFGPKEKVEPKITVG
jgi:hypothetical protein